MKGKIVESKRFIAPLLLGFLALALLSFARVSQSNLRCTSVSVQIADADEHQFITRTEVINSLTNHGTEPLEGRKCSSIKLRALEQRLLQNSFVREAQAYVNLGGELHVRIRQRVPLVRVHDPRGEAYYLDTEGERMPLSPNYTARTPVVTAQFGSRLADTSFMHSREKIRFLTEAINRDPFIRSLNGQLLWYAGDEFALYPRVGDFEIMLGDTSALENKFARLRSFYRNSLPSAGWETYRSLSLKYRNQIVAHKR